MPVTKTPHHSQHQSSPMASTSTPVGPQLSAKAKGKQAVQHSSLDSSSTLSDI